MSAEDKETRRRGEEERGRGISQKFLPISHSSLLLIFLALVLRLPGLHWGLPNAEHWYSYHPDERQIAIAVSNVATDFNPHFFNYPSLFIYLTYFAYLLQNILGLGTAAAGNAPWPVLHDIILSGHIVCALLGAFTIPAVYCIGKRLSTEKMALFAAFLMAVAPGHVQHSHFATVDVPATFFVAWGLYFAVRAMLGTEIYQSSEERLAESSSTGSFNLRFLLFSALLAGLAAATKYNAGLVLLAPLVALFSGNFKRKTVLFFGMMSLAAFAFVLGCPHSVLSTTEFLGNRTDSGLLYELLVHPRQGQDNIFTNTGNGWIYHLTFNLPFAFTAPGTLCAIVGLFVVARSKNKLWRPLLAFAGVYFFTLGLSQVRFMRYDFPLLPVLCLAVPLCFQLLPKAASKTGAAILGLVMFIGATNVLYPFCVADPRDQAADYLKKVVTKPVTVALINRPWFYTPPLWPQDYPPPSQVISGVSPNGKFRFEVIGIEPYQNGAVGPGDWFTANEFEWREESRKHHDFSGWGLGLFQLRQITQGTSTFFKNHPPFELLGRRPVPHDFLYTNPEQRVFQKAR